MRLLRPCEPVAFGAARGVGQSSVGRNLDGNVQEWELRESWAFS